MSHKRAKRLEYMGVSPVYEYTFSSWFTIIIYLNREESAVLRSLHNKKITSGIKEFIMGFGLLLIGYVFAFMFSFEFMKLLGVSENPLLVGVTQLVGLLIMLAALRRLSPYSRRFAQAVWPALALTACTLVLIGQSAVKVSNDPPVDYIPSVSPLTTVIAALSAVLGFLLHWLMIFGINEIGRETGVKKVQTKAIRNLILTAVYYAMTVVTIILTATKTGYSEYIGMVFVAYGLVWVLLNTAVIFSAYRYICLEGDDDIPYKKSRFAFINKINAEQERREREAEKKTKQYVKDNDNERASEKNKDNKKKK